MTGERKKEKGRERERKRKRRSTIIIRPVLVQLEQELGRPDPSPDVLI